MDEQPFHFALVTNITILDNATSATIPYGDQEENMEML